MDKIIQKVQNEYANISGISFWVCTPNHKRITERSLTMDFFDDQSENFFEYIDEYVRKNSNYSETKQISFEEKKVYVRCQQLFNDKQILGYCIAVKMDNFNESSEKFTQSAMFFSDVVGSIWKLCETNNAINDSMEKLKKVEKNVEEENKRLQHENDFDELTHVHSRSYFFKRLEEVDADESKLPVSVVVGDVNNLKFTNDMFGHRHGDWLLYKIAQVLQEEAAERFTVARCGGDEFYILMPNTKRAEANYYCHLVNKHLETENDTCLPASISLGAAKKSDMDQSLFRLIETADAKMYAVKSGFKSHQNQFEDMISVLESRGFIDADCEKSKQSMMECFATYLDWDLEVVRNCVSLIKYQDIGLTIVPESVYNKQEHTDREWREIKKHPQLGMKLALIRPETAPISSWVYVTHENYDGSGWPKGVSKDAIPKEAYAVRLVTEYVEHKFAYGEDSAFDFIKNQSGKIFEPDITQEFIKFITENNYK